MFLIRPLRSVKKTSWATVFASLEETMICSVGKSEKGRPVLFVVSMTL